MTRHRLEVADVFREHEAEYLASHGATAAQRGVLRAIQNCRTAVLGGHVEALIRQTTPVSKTAHVRYLDFADYWLNANRTSQRTGKAFEAVLACLGCPRWKLRWCDLHSLTPRRCWFVAAQ